MERSCGVVLINSGRVLLLQHTSRKSEGHWDFPKGHMEEGETEGETALRELKEETGISNIEFLKDFRKTIAYTFSLENRKIRKEVVFFLATTSVNKVNLSYEHADCGWFDFESALKRLTYNNARSILQNAIEFYRNNRV